MPHQTVYDRFLQRDYYANTMYSIVLNIILKLLSGSTNQKEEKYVNDTVMLNMSVWFWLSCTILPCFNYGSAYRYSSHTCKCSLIDTASA